MNNADKPAYPQDIGAIFDVAKKAIKTGIDADEVDESIRSMYGMSKRERFAMAAMQGYIASGHNKDLMGKGRYEKEMAMRSAKCADALLKALEE